MFLSDDFSVYIPWIGVITSFILVILDVYTRFYRPRIEQSIEVRKRGLDFYLDLYGNVSIITDLVLSYKESREKGCGGFLTKEGFFFHTSKQLFDLFYTAYLSFNDFFYKSKIKGYEFYLPKTLSKNLEIFISEIVNFYNDANLSSDKLVHIGELGEKITDEIENMLGV